MRHLTLQLLCLLTLLVCASLPAQARKLPVDGRTLFAEPPKVERQEAQPLRIISPEEAVRRARGQYPGKVLSVKLRGGGDYYAVKIIRDGRVRVVDVPADR